jgi:hypothetical protein
LSFFGVRRGVFGVVFSCIFDYLLVPILFLFQSLLCIGMGSFLTLFFPLISVSIDRMRFSQMYVLSKEKQILFKCFSLPFPVQSVLGDGLKFLLD